MTMSADAGKIMLGIGGCVLLGHDGKVVLADDYYPTRVPFAVGSARMRRETGFRSGSGSPDATDCVSAIESKEWEIGPTSLSPLATRTVSTFGPPAGFTVDINVVQGVFAITYRLLGGVTIPWNRVKTAKLNIRASRVDTDTAGKAQVPLNIAYTTDATQWPAVGTTSTPWSDAAWGLLGTFTPPSNGDAGEILFEKMLLLDVAGGPPPLLLALYHDIPYDTTSFAAVRVHVPPRAPSVERASLIYKLAES